MVKRLLSFALSLLERPKKNLTNEKKPATVVSMAIGQAWLSPHGSFVVPAKGGVMREYTSLFHLIEYSQKRINNELQQGTTP